MARATTASDAIPVRNLRFVMDEKVPRAWHGAGAAVTSFFNNLSIFFPAGERFFVAAVNRYKKRPAIAADASLLAEIASFCAQEGFHSREHVRYNRMLDAQGYPVAALEARVERILRFLQRVLPPRLQLSATCALEHFTATLAHCVLGDPAILDGAHPEMAGLWRWHSAEENEHKGVAFDVYQKVGGNGPERVGVMLLATAIFWSLVIEQQVRLMKHDGILGSMAEWRALLRFLFVKPGALTVMARIYLDYFRPGFHPWQLDNRALVERWKREAGYSMVAT